MLSRCAICGGDLKKGNTTLSFDKNGQVIVIRNIPALLCVQCGENYFNSETTKRLEKIRESTRLSGVEFSVLRYDLTDSMVVV